MTAISTSAPGFAAGANKRTKSPDRHKFVRALSGRIDPVRVGPFYYLGLLGAAAVMLLLPLVYLGLIGLVAYGVYYHAVYDFPTIDHSRTGRRITALKFFAYLVPFVVGIVLLLFMVKPLFGRRRQEHGETPVAREDEPLLFAFVERLCEVVGAPKPSRIEVDTRVNASASFRDGLGGFLRKDLVLTIGLPLVAGLTMRQLAGVLAHEFGHFAQGTGMRLSFVVRSINLWFARVVYERDHWDLWLRRASSDSENGAVMILALLARLFVWLTRGVLWVLMVVGHAVSSFMTRQMEFDADRYETRVAGSDEFAATSERLRLLNVASQAAFNDLQAAWQERRLGDDLALLVRHRDLSMPEEVRDALRKAVAEQKTGVFDTHPCDAARIRSSRREECPGLFQLDDPATDLFADFCTLSRDVTIGFYQRELGLDLSGDNLISSSSLITTVEKKEEAQKSVGRWFQGLVHPVRPVFLPSSQPDVADRDAAAELLLERRGQAVADGARFARLARRFVEVDKKLAALRQARAKLSAGLRVDYGELKVARADAEGLRAAEQAAAAERHAATEHLTLALVPQIERLQVALALGAPPPPAAPPAAGSDGIDLAPADDDYGEYELRDEPSGAGGGGDAFHLALAALGHAADRMEELRQNWIQLAGLLQHLRPEGNHPEPFVNEVLARSRKLVRALSDIRACLHKVPYPYEHVDRNASLALFVIKGMPEPENVGAAYQAGELAMDAYYPLYLRILSDLCSRAEVVEQSLGLDPLPEPPKVEEEDEPSEKKPTKAKKLAKA